MGSGFERAALLMFPTPQQAQCHICLGKLTCKFDVCTRNGRLRRNRCVCVYVCLFLCVCVFACLCVFCILLRTCVCMYVCVHARECVCVWCVCVCACVCVRVCVCVYVCVFVYMRTRLRACGVYCDAKTLIYHTELAPKCTAVPASWRVCSTKDLREENC